MCSAVQVHAVAPQNERVERRRSRCVLLPWPQPNVLMNTAIAGAQDPVAMAEAMKLAVRAGRLAYLAGRIPRKMYASASSPVEGLVGR